MSLPPPINPQTLAGLKVSSPKPQDIYETANATIQAHNQLVTSLGPGAAVSGKNISVPSGSQVTDVSGSVKRGKFSTTVGATLSTPHTVRLAFPPGTYSSAPFAQVIRNGGTGQSDFTYAEDQNGITITINSPKNGESYGFQYAVSE